MKEDYENENKIMLDLYKKYGQQLDSNLKIRYCDLFGCRTKPTCDFCKRKTQ